MTISRAFVKMLEDKGYGIFGQNIFLYRVPNSFQAESEVLWVIPSGGSIVDRNKTNEAIKAYQFLIYYRSTSAEKVDTSLSVLEEELNCMGCVTIPGFELVQLNTTQFAADQDLDAENRMVGLLRVQVEIYKSCEKKN